MKVLWSHLLSAMRSIALEKLYLYNAESVAYALSFQPETGNSDRTTCTSKFVWSVQHLFRARHPDHAQAFEAIVQFLGKVT